MKDHDNRSISAGDLRQKAETLTRERANRTTEDI